MKSIAISLILALATLGSMCQEKFPIKQLTFEPAQQGFPSWSPDDSKIAFTSTRTGHFDIWMVEIDIEVLKKELGIL